MISLHNKNIGRIGEKHAETHLLSRGFEIIQTNFQTHWGELDIIAVKENKLSFFEVKTRVGDKFGKPHEAVTFFKLNHLKRPIQHFLLKNNFKNYKLSLDVISIVLNDNLTVKNLKHFPNAGTY